MADDFRSGWNIVPGDWTKLRQIIQRLARLVIRGLRADVDSIDGRVGAMEDAVIDFDIPLVTNLTFSWNAGTSKIEWTEGTLTYKGVAYTISSGSSIADATVVYVDVDSLSDPVTLESALVATIVVTQWPLCVRLGTTVYPAFQSPIIEGGYVKANSIGAEQINTENLFAENIEITGSLYVGNPSYASNEDFWLGIDTDDVAKFRIGGPSSYITVEDGVMTLTGVGGTGNVTYSSVGGLPTPPSDPTVGDIWYVTLDSTDGPPATYKQGRKYRCSSLGPPVVWTEVGNLIYNTTITAGQISLAYTYVTGGPPAGATVGATWGTNLLSIPTRFSDSLPSGTGQKGVVLTPDGLGFYSSDSIQVSGSASGTFQLGEKVTQATTAAWGIVSGKPSAAIIYVLVKSGTFSGTYTVTGAISGATLTTTSSTASGYEGFTTFVSASGQFFFNGNATNYIGWDGSIISVYASGGYIGSATKYFNISTGVLSVTDASGYTAIVSPGYFKLTDASGYIIFDTSGRTFQVGSTSAAKVAKIYGTLEVTSTSTFTGAMTATAGNNDITINSGVFKPGIKYKSTMPTTSELADKELAIWVSTSDSIPIAVVYRYGSNIFYLSFTQV